MVGEPQPESVRSGNPLLRAIRRQRWKTKKEADHCPAALTKREAPENTWEKPVAKKTLRERYEEILKLRLAIISLKLEILRK